MCVFEKLASFDLIACLFVYFLVFLLLFFSRSFLIDHDGMFHQVATFHFLFGILCSGAIACQGSSEYS